MLPEADSYIKAQPCIGCRTVSHSKDLFGGGCKSKMLRKI